jgi:hypothetical protein
MIRKLSRGLALAVLVGSTTVNAALIPFAVNLTGAQEAPGPGDPDGTGTALLIFDSASNRLDWRITAKNIDPVVAAHIHSAPAGVAGPVVIDFSGALTGTVIDPDVASVLANPAGFYVNVHTPVFPAGAVRGQLTARSSVVPEPASLALLAVVLAALAVARRRTQQLAR